MCGGRAYDPGLTRTKTTSCEGTVVANTVVTTPWSFFAQRSRTRAAADAPRPSSVTPRRSPRPASSGSAAPRRRHRPGAISSRPRGPRRRGCACPACPSGSWSTAMTSVFSRIVAGRRRSWRGCRCRPSAAPPACAHRLKCARYSAVVMPPLPTSQHVGIVPAARARRTSRARPADRGCRRAQAAPLVLQSQQSRMSPVVRQRWPTPRPTSTACCVPHSHMLNTIGRPVARSASRIVG